MGKIAIQEVIVVEGRDDIANIQQYVETVFIATHGFQLRPHTLKQIVQAAEQKGIIVFTDPDFAGNVIRKRIVKAVHQADPTGAFVVKHAYISAAEGTRGDDVGVENASGEAILQALQHAHAELQKTTQAPIYTERDLFQLGLSGQAYSKQLRMDLGQYLRIGYGNSKQFLQRLNRYQIQPEQIAAFFEQYQMPEGWDL